VFTGFLPQDLDDSFAKFFHAHRFSGVGMYQEGLIRFWLALDLRASDHTHERDQIIRRCGVSRRSSLFKNSRLGQQTNDNRTVESRTAFILELLEELCPSHGCPGSSRACWLRVYDDPPNQVPRDLKALVDHHVREPNVPQLRQETFKCRNGRLDSNLSIFPEKYAFYVRKDKGCRAP
jgi:hypothetical protein